MNIPAPFDVAIEVRRMLDAALKLEEVSEADKVRLEMAIIPVTKFLMNAEELNEHQSKGDTAKIIESLAGYALPIMTEINERYPDRFPLSALSILMEKLSTISGFSEMAKEFKDKSPREQLEILTNDLMELCAVLEHSPNGKTLAGEAEPLVVNMLKHVERTFGEQYIQLAFEVAGGKDATPVGTLKALTYVLKSDLDEGRPEALSDKATKHLNASLAKSISTDNVAVINMGCGKFGNSVSAGLGVQGFPDIILSHPIPDAMGRIIAATANYWHEHGYCDGLVSLGEVTVLVKPIVNLDGLLELYAHQLVGFYREYPKYAPKDGINIVQVMLPDNNGKYPTDADYNEKYAQIHFDEQVRKLGRGEVMH